MLESIHRYEEETRELENQEKSKQEKIRKLLHANGNASSAAIGNYNSSNGNDSKDTVVIELQNHMIDL